MTLLPDKSEPKTADDEAVSKARELFSLLSRQKEVDDDLRSLLAAIGSEQMVIVADPVSAGIMLTDKFSEDEAGLLPKQLLGRVLTVPFTLADFSAQNASRFINDAINAAAVANGTDWKKAETIAAVTADKLEARIPFLIDAMGVGKVE